MFVGENALCSVHCWLTFNKISVTMFKSSWKCQLLCNFLPKVKEKTVPWVEKCQVRIPSENNSGLL